MRPKNKYIVTCGLFGILTSEIAAQTTTTERKDSLQGNLQGITVSAERSDLKVEDGRIGYSLNQIARRYTVNNTWEALSKLPGVIEKDGTFQLAGTNATVILNSRPTTMTLDQLAALLKNTPVDRVEKVEVMHSAPPQYHIRGAAINVILKRERSYSLQGEVNSNYVNRFFSYGNLGGNIRLSSPKVTLDVMYNAARKKNIQTIDLDSRHTFKQQVYDIRQYQEIRQKHWAHDFRTALDWHLTKDDNLNVTYTGSYSPSYTRNSQTHGNFQDSNVDADGNNYMHNVSFAYTSGFGLQAGGDYTYYKLRNNQDLKADYTDGTSTVLHMSSVQRIDRYKLYADQDIKLKRNWTLGFGGSYTYANDRDYQNYNKVEGNITPQNTASGLKEYTTNFYVSFGKNYVSGTSFSISATGESYKIGDYQSWSVYPQASFTYVFSPRHILQFDLSTDKQYPSYWEMQSAVSYIDGYSEIWGTPGLRPYKEYNATASYILRQKYIFTFFLNRSNDYFVQAAYQATDRLALIYQNLNWNYSQQIGFQSVLPFTITKWYNTRISLTGLQIHERADHYHDLSFNKHIWMGVISLNNSFKAGKHLLFDLDGSYQSSAIQGTYDIGSLFKLSASAQYTFAGDKASISLKCNDILNAGDPHTKVHLGSQYMDQDTNKYTRSVSLHFSYRFGGYKKKEIKEVDTSRFGH